MKKAFVIMPFDDGTANAVYEHCTKPICKEFNLEVERADEIFTSNPILDDIVSAIEKAAVIIADISGKNPNVFYELGMSHILKRKQTIMVTQDEFKGIPFDISHFRIIQYKNTIPGKSAYEKQLRDTLRNILLDYKLIYKDEFEFLLDFLISHGQETILYPLMALAKSPKPLHGEEQLFVEGHYGKISSSMIDGSTKNALLTFINSGFAEVSGDFFILTDKGKAFVELLEEKGFVCDIVNEYILSEGYVSKHEKLKLGAGELKGGRISGRIIEQS